MTSCKPSLRLPPASSMQAKQGGSSHGSQPNSHDVDPTSWLPNQHIRIQQKLAHKRFFCISKRHNHAWPCAEVLLPPVCTVNDAAPQDYFKQVRTLNYQQISSATSIAALLQQLQCQVMQQHQSTQSPRRAKSTSIQPGCSTQCASCTARPVLHALLLTNHASAALRMLSPGWLLPAASCSSLTKCRAGADTDD